MEDTLTSTALLASSQNPSGDAILTSVWLELRAK